MVEVTLEVSATVSGDLLRGLLQSLERPFAGVEREAVALLRASVAEEFAGGFWKSPSGARVPWKPAQPFGLRDPGEPLGGASGDLADAWAGGPGGFEAGSPDRVAIGVDRPDAAVHRGGAGTSVDPRQVTRIKAKKPGARGLPAMFWRLGLELGAWVRPETLLGVGLAVPARPHATTNPGLEADLAALVLRGLLGSNR